MERHSAYTELLKRHRDMLWGMCWRRVNGDRDRCLDLLQEVFIAIWENFGKLRPNVSAGEERAWVRWQARSVFSQMERRRVLPVVPMTDSMEESLAEEGTDRRKELIEELMSVLGPEEKRMMRLYLDGYHGDEIGERLGVSRDTVYQRMRRAIHKMRRVALLLFALLFASALAVALVPQWRQAVYGGGEPAHDESFEAPPEWRQAVYGGGGAEESKTVAVDTIRVQIFLVPDDGGLPEDAFLDEIGDDLIIDSMQI